MPRDAVLAVGVEPLIKSQCRVFVLMWSNYNLREEKIIIFLNLLNWLLTLQLYHYSFR